MGSRISFCSWEGKTLSTTGILSSRFPETVTKGCYQKKLDMINGKNFTPYRPFCFADFVGTSFLACLLYPTFFLSDTPLRFLLPHHNCFLRVCLHALFAVVLKVHLPPTTSAISGRATSIKSGPLAVRLGGHIYAKLELPISQ